MCQYRRRGITIVELLVMIAVVSILIALILPAVQAARESARKTACKNNLKQFGVALHAYQLTYHVFPFGVGGDGDTGSATFSSENNRRFSLHSQLLPYLDQQKIFEQINFNYSPFYPDTTGEPLLVTGTGPNETIAQLVIPVFLCPSDENHLQTPWGPNNYRSCSGSSWSGRKGNGLFGQNTSVKPAHVRDGLSNTAAFSERIMGDGDRGQIDLDSDLFGMDSTWTEETFRDWCSSLDASTAASVDTQDPTSGMTWLEGNMLWTRYNHFLPPGSPSCKTRITWEGVSMAANSHHGGGVFVLFADGSVRFNSYSIDDGVWRALGTMNGGEAIE